MVGECVGRLSHSPRAILLNSRKIALNLRSTDTIVGPAPAKTEKGRWFVGFLALACTGLALEVALLARKNHDLNEQLARAIAAARQ